MPKSRPAPQLSVYDILNKAQDGIAGHKKFAKLLWDIVSSDLCTTFQQLTNCISHLLLVAQGANLCAERAIKFLAVFTAQQPAGDEAEGFVEDLLTYLARLSEARDKEVRRRVCQLLDQLLNSLKADADLSEELVLLLQKSMLKRLRDKLAPVRCHAVRVLMRLAEPGEAGDYAGCPVIAGYRSLLSGEKEQGCAESHCGLPTPFRLHHPSSDRAHPGCQR
eukprot:jgi/Botrbrau1/13169/Bobra.242_1s0006.1